jgi:hypothetical protein
MPQLHTILAVEKDAKAQGESALTKAYQMFQKTALLSGISRVYRPKDEEGDKLPPESTRVQVNVEATIEEVAQRLGRLFDVVATKETTNTVAKADVVVDGSVLLADVPATVLLFLERKLVDLRTFISKLPTLDPAEVWHPDEATNTWATEPYGTARTKKIPRNHVLAEATDRHPAQVQMYHEDVIVGEWTTIKHSGALPAKRVAELVERVEKLQRAVKVARQVANGTEVKQAQIAGPVIGYLFG